MNSWEDIRWFDAQFIFVPNFYNHNLNDISRGLLDMNLYFLLEEQRWMRTPTTANINPIRATLPVIHSYGPDDKKRLMTDVENCQLTENPADIVFIMANIEYIMLGKMLLNMNLDYKMRRSNDTVNGNQKHILWSIIGTESLLTEPISSTLLRIKVRLTSSVLFSQRWAQGEP